MIRTIFVLLLCPTLAVGQQLTSIPCPPYCNFKTLTFQTNGKQLFDPCGQSIVLKGVNKMAVYDYTDPVGATYFREIAKTKANCVRLSWEMKSQLNGHTVTNPLSRLDQLITNARANKLIPIVGLWDYTGLGDGGFSKLDEYVTYWTSPAMLALIRKHQTHLIINIANEAAAGDENNTADLNAYALAYKRAVRRLRQAGIHVPLMIDGMDHGKSLHCFAVKGVDMANDDPDHNLIFSFHPYWAKLDTDAEPAFIQDKFAGVSALNIPIVMGELSKYGAYAGSPDISICSDQGEVDYSQFVQRAETAGMGWLIWEWGPGNEFETPAHVHVKCPNMDMTTNGTYATIGTNRSATTGAVVNDWTNELAISAAYSIQRSAQHTFFINSGLKSCPND